MYVIKQNAIYNELIYFQSNIKDMLEDMTTKDKLHYLATQFDKRFSSQTARERNYILESSQRAKRNIIDYALNNDFNYFVTITFDKKKINRYDYELLLKKLTQWLNNFQKRKDNNFKYVLVPELHTLKKKEKKAALHFHMLCRRNNIDDLYFLKEEDKRISYRDKNIVKTFGLRNEWTLIYDGLKFISWYMSKYVTKGIDKMILDKHFYNSKNMKKSIEIFRSRKLLPPRIADYENQFCKKWNLTEKETIKLIQENS